MNRPTLNVLRAEKCLDDAGLFGLIASTPENVFYASGLDSLGLVLNRYRSRIFVVSPRARLTEPVVVAALGDSGAIGQSCPPGTHAVHYGGLFRLVADNVELDGHEQWVKEHVVDGRIERDPLAALARAIKEADLSSGRVGYDEQGIGEADILALKRLLPGIAFVPASALFRKIRAVKTAEEIRRLEASLRLTERALSAALAVARPGVSEAELVHEYAAVVAAGGGITFAVDLTFGRRGALGVATMLGSPTPHSRPLKEGDLIRFDGGCKVDGYFSDIARTFVFRAPAPRRAEQLYTTLVMGEEHALSLLRPGVALSDVFDGTMRAVRTAGISGYGRHHIGHSIGLEIYDGAMIAPTEDALVEEGMVLEVEVPYQELGYGGLQIEDTVIVGATGVEMITEISREIERVE